MQGTLEQKKMGKKGETVSGAYIFCDLLFYPDISEKT